MRRWYHPDTIEASRYMMKANQVRAESSSRQGARREHSSSISFVDGSGADSKLLQYILPSRDIDITRLAIDVSVEEILTFFPAHLQWSSVMGRLLRNGWDENSLVSYFNYSRNWHKDDPHFQTAAKIVQYVNNASRRQFGGTYSLTARRSPAFQREWPAMSDMAPRAFRYDGHGRVGHDVSLRRLADGVVFWPTGSARGALTVAVELALNDFEGAYSLEHVNILARLEDGACALKQTLDGSNHDRDGLRRARAILENPVWRG